MNQKPKNMARYLELKVTEVLIYFCITHFGVSIMLDSRSIHYLFFNLLAIQFLVYMYYNDLYKVIYINIGDGFKSREEMLKKNYIDKAIDANRYNKFISADVFWVLLIICQISFYSYYMKHTDILIKHSSMIELIAICNYIIVSGIHTKIVVANAYRYFKISKKLKEITNWLIKNME